MTTYGQCQCKTCTERLLKETEKPNTDWKLREILNQMRELIREGEELLKK